MHDSTTRARIKTTLKTVYAQTGSYLIKFLHLQLFLTLMSWPVLLYWGLPISLASIVGNLIFGPFLLVFLLLSSLIFLGEFLSIPTTLLIWLLEYISNLWYTILLWSDRSWLLFYAQPSFIVASLVCAATLLVLHHKKLTPLQASSLFTCLLLIFLLYLTFTRLNPGTYPLDCFDKQLTLIATKHTTVLIDPGILGRRSSAPDYIRYTLIPQLSKKGISHIDSIITCKPSLTTFRALATLCHYYPVNAVYIPAWHGQLTHTGWHAWEQLKSTAEKYNTQIITLDTSTALVPLSTTEHLCITSQALNKRNKLIYPELTLTQYVAGKSVAFMP